MARYIDADSLDITTIITDDYSGNEILDVILKEDIDNAPTADVQPVIHAKWLGTESDGYSDGFPVYTTWKCSNCGTEFECEDMDFHYCPRCGAYMDKEQEDGNVD